MDEKEMSMREALNLALDQAMAADDRVFLLGEDIADPGASGPTAGLSTKYGHDRVLDTPISEAAIIGAAVGAAIDGLLPVAEIMIMDFIGIAADQLINNAAKLRFMTAGRTTAPITVRTQVYGGLATGATHSQTLEAWFMHIPGMKVIVPSTPRDGKGLLTSAIFDPDPCLFVETIRLQGQKGLVPTDPGFSIPLGQADVKRPGSDITLISYGRSVLECLAAAKTLQDQGVSAEVIDLRTLVPLDVDTIVASVRRTRHAVVVHDAVQFAGPGAEIVATLQAECFGELAAPIGRVARQVHPNPRGGGAGGADLPVVGARRRGCPAGAEQGGCAWLTSSFAFRGSRWPSRKPSSRSSSSTRASTLRKARPSTSSPPRKWSRKSRLVRPAPCSGRARSGPPTTSAPKSASSLHNERLGRHMDLNETRERIIYQKEGPIAKITLNWPEKANAQDQKLAEEVDAALLDADRDYDIKVLVLKANGKGFCSGHAIGDNATDYPAFVENAMVTGHPWKAQSDLFVKPTLNLWEFSKPTIAQVHGYCVGGGTHMGLTTDIVIASEDAYFSYPPLQGFGMPSGECSIEPWVFMNWRRAAYYLFTAEVIDAKKALEVGLVNEVVKREELDDRVDAIARHIAQAPLTTLMLTKANLKRAWELMGMRVHWQSSNDLVALASISKDVQELIQRVFKDKVLPSEMAKRQAAASTDGAAT